MAVSEARFGNLFQSAYRNPVPNFFQKPLLANGERKIPDSSFRGVSIVLKSTENTYSRHDLDVHRRYCNPPARASCGTSSLEKVSTNRESFVANLVWKNGERLVAKRDIGIVQAELNTHSVVVVQNANLTLDEHIALTKLLGEPEVVTDMRNHHPDSLHVLVVNNSGRMPVIGNLCWHSDRSFLKKPTRYSRGVQHKQFLVISCVSHIY